MPHVDKLERYVEIGYTLRCGYERATALADDLAKRLKDDKGLWGAKDDTRGWDGDRQACVKVTYCTLADAIRLEPEVRRLLSRNADFTYDAKMHISYGGRGPTSYVTSKTTLIPK